MKNAMSAIFVASLLVAAAAAQGQPPAPGQQPTAQQPATQFDQSTRAQKPEAGKVTISGCVENAPPAADAAAAPAKTASKFELANAKVTSGGPVGTSGSAATTTRYRLEGEEKSISPHLNHQVEITGTISPASGTPAAGGSAAPTLKVESVKMVAAKCSE